MTPQQQIARELFAQWLAVTYPEAFSRLAQLAGTHVTPSAQLGGFTDILQSIGTSIGTTAQRVASTFSGAVKQVGTFLGSNAGQQALTSIVGVYAAKQGMDANAAAIALQNERAAAQQPPAPIQTVYDPVTQTYVPVIQQGGMQVPLDAARYGQWQPSFIDQYGTPLLIGGGLILLYLIARKT